MRNENSIWCDPREAAEILNIGYPTLRRLLASRVVSSKCARKFYGQWRLKRAVLLDEGLPMAADEKAAA